MKKLGIVFLLAIMVFSTILIGCSPKVEETSDSETEGNNSDTATTEESFNIGLAISMTGGTALFGEGVKMGAELANAGKTTLLRAITGLLKLKEGTIAYKEHIISGLPAYKLIEHGIAHVPQGRQVFGDQSVEDNLILGAYKIRKDKKKIA